MESKDTLWHINWGDGDDLYIVAPSKHKAIGLMEDGKDMVNYATRLDATYERIYKAGIKTVVEWVEKDCMIKGKGARTTETFTEGDIAICKDWWQFQLKEWEGK